MFKGKIDELYERSHVVHETPYEASVVDPSIVAVHQQRVWNRYLFAELMAKRMLDIVESHSEIFQTERDRAVIEHIKQSIKTDFGVEDV